MTTDMRRLIEQHLFIGSVLLAGTVGELAFLLKGLVI